jgi:hypothetical protein
MTHAEARFQPSVRSQADPPQTHARGAGLRGVADWSWSRVAPPDRESSEERTEDAAAVPPRHWSRASRACGGRRAHAAESAFRGMPRQSAGPARGPNNSRLAMNASDSLPTRAASAVTSSRRRSTISIAAPCSSVSSAYRAQLATIPADSRTGPPGSHDAQHPSGQGR